MARLKKTWLKDLAHTVGLTFRRRLAVDDLMTSKVTFYCRNFAGDTNRTGWTESRRSKKSSDNFTEHSRS